MQSILRVFASSRQALIYTVGHIDPANYPVVIVKSMTKSRLQPETSCEEFRNRRSERRFAWLDSRLDPRRCSIENQASGNGHQGSGISRFNIDATRGLGRHCLFSMNIGFIIATSEVFARQYYFCRTARGHIDIVTRVKKQRYG